MTAYNVLCIVLVAWNSVYILRGLGGETMINSDKKTISQLYAIIVGEECQGEKKK